MTTKIEPGTSFQTPTGWTCDAHRGGEIVARFYGADCAERARKFCADNNAPTAPALAEALRECESEISRFYDYEHAVNPLVKHGGGLAGVLMLRNKARAALALLEGGGK